VRTRSSMGGRWEARAPACRRTPRRTAWGRPSAGTSPAAPWRQTLPHEERPSRQTAARCARSPSASAKKYAERGGRRFDPQFARGTAAARAASHRRTAAGAIIRATRGNDARRPRPPHTAARRSRDLVLVRSLAPRFRARARGTTGLADRPSRGPPGGARRRARRRPARGADPRGKARAIQHVFPPQPGQARPPGAEALREEHARGARGEAPQRGTRAEPRRASPFVSPRSPAPPPRGFGPRPPARRERDPPRRSIDVTLGVSTPTRPAGAPLAEGNVPEPRSESGLAQPPLTSRSRRNPLSPLSRRWRAAARVATGSSS